MSLMEDEGGVRHTDPSPSHDAAASIDPKILVGILLKTLEDYKDWMTYFQMARVSGLPLSSVTPRGVALMKTKLVERKIDRGVNDRGVTKDLLHFKFLEKV